MPRARLYGDWDPERNKGNIMIMCPGCECIHIIATITPLGNGAIWSFNGNMDRPTFSPSLLIKSGSYAKPGFIDPPEIPPSICHSFITDGMIQFLGDCTHKLANQTVDLPEIEKPVY